MSDEPKEPGESDKAEERDDADDVLARRKRAEQRAKVFGDVLPDTTSDEDEKVWGDEGRSSEDWLKRQVPPHHG